MIELLAAIRALVNDPAGFTTAHPALSAWLPAEIGYAAKTLVVTRELVKDRDGTGRVRFRGAHLPRPRRKNKGIKRDGSPMKPRPSRTLSPAGERMTDVFRRLAKHPHGFSVKHAELAHWCTQSVSNTIGALVRRGELFMVKAGVHTNFYYGKFDDAQAALKVLQANVSKGGNGYARGRLTVQAPHVEGPADSSRAKLTVCPGFVPRFTALDVLCPLLRQAPYRRAA